MQPRVEIRCAKNHAIICDPLIESTVNADRLFRAQCRITKPRQSSTAEISFTETLPISEETGFGYSMGWGYYYFHGAKVLEKGGALDGARAVIVLVPERHPLHHAPLGPPRGGA